MAPAAGSVGDHAGLLARGRGMRLARIGKTMINKAFEQIDREDIHALVNNKVAEGRTLDYKEQLPGNRDEDKREFLADVTSFANAAGGDLVYGVREHQGLPEEARGLANVDADHEILRLEQIIQAGVEPRIIGVRTRQIDSFPRGSVIVLRIPKSWNAPHMVTYRRGSSRFFTRDSRGKHHMDVVEIRHAFALSEALPEKIRRFREERLARIVAGETPVVLEDGAKIVLHLLPVAAVDPTTRVCLVPLRNSLAISPPGGTSTGERRYNFDGLVSHAAYCGEPGVSYLQVFRSGAFEAVETLKNPPLAFQSDAEQQSIPSVAYERELIRQVGRYLGAIRDLGLAPPVFVLVAFLGVKGLTLQVDPNLASRQEAYPMDRDDLILPDVVVDNFSADPGRLLQPVFDAVWQSAGWPRSRNYNDEGMWVGD